MGMDTELAVNRIVFVNRVFDPDQSATSRLLTDLAKATARHHRVLVVCSRTAEALPPLTDDLEIHRAPFGRKDSPGLLKRALSDFGFLAYVAVILTFRLRAGDLVVTKTDPPLLGVLGALVTSIRRVPLIVWHQDVYPEIAIELGVISADSWLTRMLVRLRDWSLRRAHCNVAIGQDMARYLAQRGGRMKSIPNWALNEDAQTSEGGSELRASLNPEPKFVVAHSGTLGRVHPTEPLWALIDHSVAHPSATYLLSGGGARFQEIQDRVRSAGASNWLFLPYQPEHRLPDLLAAADVHLVLLMPGFSRFVVPSKLQGVLAAQRPVVFVGDPQCDIARLVVGAKCGVAVHPDDPAGLIAELETLRAHPMLRTAMGAAGRALYEQHFSRCGAIRQWEQIFADCFAAVRAG